MIDTKAQSQRTGAGTGTDNSWSPRRRLRSHPADDPKRAAAPFRLLLRDDKGAERFEEADVVFDCTGTYGRHAWLGAFFCWLVQRELVDLNPVDRVAPA